MGSWNSYAYTGGGDTADVTLNASNGLVERSIGLPGGIVVTKTAAGAETWALPNIHGDVLTTSNTQGTKTAGVFYYDPYGDNPTPALADTTAGQIDNAWLGKHQRPTEHATPIPPRYLKVAGGRPKLTSANREERPPAHREWASAGPLRLVLILLPIGSNGK